MVGRGVFSSRLWAGFGGSGVLAPLCLMPHGFCVGRQLSRGRGGRRTFSCARPFVELEAHRCVVRGNGLRLLLSLLLSPLQFSLQLPHPGLGRQPAFLGLCLCFLGCICLCPFSLEGGNFPTGLRVSLSGCRGSFRVPPLVVRPHRPFAFPARSCPLRLRYGRFASTRWIFPQLILVILSCGPGAIAPALAK